MRFRIFYKFLITISIFTLFPLIWLGTSLLKRSEEAVKTSTKELHLNLVESFESSLRSEVEKYNALSDFVNKIFLQFPDWTLRQVILDSIVKSYEGVESVSIASSKGEEFIKISLKKTSKLSKIPESIVNSAFKNGLFIHFDIEEVKYIYSQRNYFIIFDFNKEFFYEKIFFKKISNTAFFIFKKNGEVLFYKTFMDINDAIIATLASNNSILSLSSLNASGVFEIPIQGSTYIGAVSCLENLNLCLGSVQKKTDAFSYVDLAKKQAILVIFSAILISLIGSYFLSKMLTDPIIKFIDVAKKVADKDFSVRVDVSTADELDDLRDTFNKMIEEIDKYSKLQIEKILRERKNVEAVMYSSLDGMIMVDKDWNVQIINRRALSLIKPDLDDERMIIGKDLIENIGNESFKKAIEEIKSGKNKIELKWEKKDRIEYFRIEKTDIKIKEADDLFGYLITLYDITYDKELEKIKDDFLHSITHDLRNPVSAIKGFSEFLLKEIAGPINQNQRNMIISIDRAAFRLLGMINNILDIAKMEAGKMEIVLSSFNVVETIHRCIDLMKILGEKKNIKFIVDAPTEIMVSADVGLIERVYINLIGNAIKFTPENGTITVGALIDGDNIKSWVEDTGDGIPLDYIDKIFEKFEQVKGQKGGGTGLGLTICKYIVEAHLGKIWAEWRPNKGAKIVFSFPLNLSKDEFGRTVKT